MSDSFPGTPRNKLCMSSKVSLGVVLCIPPFNYPVNLAVSKVAPALMAGNAVVLKPPTQGARVFLRGFAWSAISLQSTCVMRQTECFHAVLECPYTSAIGSLQLCSKTTAVCAGAVAGLHMVHAFHLAGVPPGLIQCVTGKGSEIGDYMTTHSGADCISFTGASAPEFFFVLDLFFLHKK
jgi:glyceraldehyde-3-phosphate dehydrogenase (NADP+)